MVKIKAQKDKVATESFVLQVVGQTEQILNLRIDGLEQKIEELDRKQENRFDKMMVNLDWLVGAYKKFDEEHTILTVRVANHDDRIEKLEGLVFQTN